MVKTSECIQIIPAECGVAALSIILAHYGHPIPLEVLSLACGVSETNTGAGQLLKVARQCGLRSQAMRVSVSDLLAGSEKPPFVVFWNHNHFAVVEGVEEEQIYLNDPACGRRVVSSAVFAQSYSHLILRFEPDAGVKPDTLPQVEYPEVVTRLRAGLRGGVGWLPYQTRPFRHDFGRVYERFPMLVVRAICEEDVQHTLRVATEIGMPVSTRGAGHARNGQPLSEGGIVLINYLPDVAQCRMIDETQVEMSGRTRWKEAEAFVNQYGRSLPVLPAYELLSVAGTLSVGGYGERSVRYGSQIHHVKRLKLVLANGRSLWCSPQKNADLFRFNLAGLGQVGVIEQVVMDTIPYQPEIAPLVYHYPTADEFLSGLEWLNVHSHQVDRFAGYYIHGQGYFAEWWIRELGQAPAGQRVTEVPAFRTQESQDEGYRLAADYLFDLEGLASSLKWLENQWHNTTLEQYAAWALILAVKPGVSDTLFPFEAKSMKPGATGLHFLVGFYPVVEMEDEPGLAFIRQLFRQGLKLCVAENGRPYLYGFHELDEATKQQLYGEDYQHLKQLRQQYDPQNLLNRGSL